MPPKSKITPEYVKAYWSDLEPRFRYEWDRMLLVEAWRTLNRAALEDHIWSGVARQDRGTMTIVKNHVAAVTASAIALASSPEPNVTVRMRNRISPQSRDASHYNRRAALAMRSEVNRSRAVPFEDEVTDFIFSRGVGITKHWHMDSDERGEVRERITADVAQEMPAEPVIDVTDDDGVVIEQQRVVEEGDFPCNVDVLDPLDCVYVIGPGKSGVKCFIHHYLTPPEDLLATFPDAREKLNLGEDIKSSEEFEVWDYWDEEYHAIVVNGEFYYPPTEHYYKKLPFEIERVNEQKVFISTYGRGGVTELPNGERGRLSSHDSGPQIRVATPFAWPMIDDVAKASFAESLLASKLPEMANSPIIHQGISTGEAGRPASPYFQREQRSDGRISRVPVYRFKGDKTSAGRPLWPAFDGENFYPLNPTPIADHLAIFMQQRNADLEISGMNAEMLSGRMKSDVSGYAANQMMQLTSARMNPYVGARNRLVSKTLTGMFNDLADNWDRYNTPFILTSLTDEEDIPLTREMVENVVEVVYTIENIFPRDRQAEMQMAFQMQAQGAMPLTELITVYGKAEDPKDWLEQMAWEMVAFQGAENVSKFVMDLAMSRHKKMGYGELQPSQQAQQQAGQMQQMAQMEQMAQMAAMQGGAPQGPQQPGGPQQGPDAGAGLDAALAAAMGGGS